MAPSSTLLRSALLLLGLLLLLTALGELIRPGFDALPWLADLQALGRAPRLGLFAFTGWALLRLALASRPLPATRRGAVVALQVLLGASALSLLLTLLAGLPTGVAAALGPADATSPWARLILVFLLCLTLRALDPAEGRAERGAAPVPLWRGPLRPLATIFQVAALGTGLALLHILGFQPTLPGLRGDGVRADAAVVFGARAYASGRASLPLRARVEAACELRARGQVRKLILSGGPADGRLHETDVMRRLALACGVPAADVLIDRDGWSTHGTVRGSLRLARDHQLGRLVAVSQSWHLARIALDFRRQGSPVATVAAREERSLLAMPRQLLREVIALWGYVLLHPPRTPAEGLAGTA